MRFKPLHLCFFVVVFVLPRSSARKNAARASSSAKKLTKSHLKSALQESRKLVNNESKRPSVPVSVESILLPRIFPLKGLIRLGCIGLISISLFQCLATAGIPHIQTIWGLLHGIDVPMPDASIPTMADLQLSQLIAISTNEILPPVSLPSVGPLLRVFGSVLLFTVTTVLIPRWSTAAKVFLEYRKISINKPRISTLIRNPSKAAVLVKILDRHLQAEVASQEEQRKSVVICPLHWVTKDATVEDESPLPEKGVVDLHFSHPSLHFFELNQCRYYFGISGGGCIDGGPLLHAAPIRDLYVLFYAGISSAQNRVAQERYVPYNRPRLATPTIAEAFAARVSSPLVVIQFVGRLLSCLEDGLHALLGLAVTALEHLFNARQAIASVRQMANEVKNNVKDTSSLEVQILETNENGDRKWVSKSAGALIPGDVFVMAQNGNEFVTMPVDALLLAGMALANEAVLTGESVPQSKIPIDFVERMNEEQCACACLDLDSDRNSILYAGTTLIHCSNTANQTEVQGVPIPEHDERFGVICMALRTGTYSSKGQLMRTLKSGSNIGAISNPQSEKDSIRLILSLSLFATASSVSLFLPRESGTSAAVPTFRRIIQITRILIAGIPSDLPLALSAVARSCSERLRQDSDVICSEPGALLTAAYVDTVVFDKTGTITADTQSVSKLISPLSDEKHEHIESFQLAILAGCHSLVHLDAASTSETNSQVVGDPLDQAAFDYSGWKYNRICECYERQDLANATSLEPIRLYQLKSFPFDPSKRLSTAVVVLETGGGSLRMVSFTKGSSDTIRGMYASRVESDFMSWFEKQVEEFESQGYRSIALGWKDLSGTEFCTEMFPKGIAKDDIRAARQRGSSFHRKDFESDELQFGGFVQFDASIRPSSRRIIEELNASGITSIMLTGDAVDAAVNVARKVGLIERNRVAILEEKSDGTKSLHWRIVRLRRGKGGRVTTPSPSSDIIPFSSSSLKNLLKQEKVRKISLATTGNVLEMFLAQDEITDDAWCAQDFLDNLARVSVIARATPKQKKAVISHLKRHCDRTVMMCGDGVNDVAAMKAADVSVSFLNGFGDEKSMAGGTDFDDERRRKKVQAQLLGSQRSKKHSELNIARKEGRERINQQIQKMQAEVRARAAARKGVDPDSMDVKFEFEDMKDLMSASLKVMKEERRRQRSLRRGGGEAARILAEERRGENLPAQSDTEVVPTIKPGEASLVAPFSCLHPSIDGVDAVLRASIGTAACALATQELISLHSLMSCANMGSLYRESVRYGKQMMMVENMLYMLVDQQRYQLSRIPRPRLPSSSSIRPPPSMFHPSAIWRTMVQAALNLITMNLAVGYAKGLEQKSGPKPAYQLQLVGDHTRKISQMLTAIASSVSNEGETRSASVFRRPPFRPNYETNAIFVFSVLQNMLVSLTNHRGRPFYRGILESEAFTSLALGVIGFCVACVAESSPRLNSILQLKSLPDRKSRVLLLGLVVFNIVASLGVNCLFLGRPSSSDERPKPSSPRTRAADLEEQLLKEEFDRNLRRCFMGIVVIGYLAISAV